MNPTNTTATLNGHHGTLRVTVLGYEHADATSVDGGEWLVARVEWQSRTATVSHEGAILTTTELDELAAAMAGASSPRPRHLRFIEPNLSLTRSFSADGATAERVSIAVVGEPREGHPTFEATTTVTPADIRAFGRALQRVAASLRVTALPAVA